MATAIFSSSSCQTPDASKYYNEGSHLLRASTIRLKTEIDLPISTRNGRKQAQHLQYARGVRQIKGSLGELVSGGGRPDKQRIVLEWKKNNPKGKKIECYRETGLSRVTIDKWWN